MSAILGNQGRNAHQKIMTTKGEIPPQDTEAFLLGSNILVLQKEHHGIPGGSLLVPNAELGGRTSGNTTHMVYKSIFALKRAFSHIMQKQGMDLGGCFGEFHALYEGAGQYDAIMRTALSGQPLSDAQEKTLSEGTERLIRLLGTPRNPHKQRAKEKIRRSIRRTDRRGRTNLGAAKAVKTSVSRSLQRRIDQIIQIMIRVSKRLAEVTALIQKYRSAYRMTWSMVSEDSLQGMLKRNDAAPLRQCARDLAIIDTLPVRINAGRTAADLSSAVDIMESSRPAKEQAFREMALKARQGAFFMSVLLQIEEVIELDSSLLVWKRLSQRARQQKLVGALSEKEEKAEIARRFKPVRAKIGKILAQLLPSSDDRLNVRVRAAVLEQIEAAKGTGETMLHVMYALLTKASAVL